MKHDLGYNAAAKATFHRLGKRALLDLAKEMGLARSDFNISNNKAGIAVSGEITLHTDNVYIQLSQRCFGSGNEILYRTCTDRKDYTGGANHTAPVEALENIPQFKDNINLLIG